ncbi:MULTISPECIES: hypothetical protein [unclassified Synechocystis]|uniref:hypothetical protein n=1 Tax=unclassified Synechocystis TaxID=2640012 RepID=UPI0003F74624|nr:MULTISPECIES: hypothetical protein [unclassified Synechocystis]AIE73992.1 hypothetical protein D082_14640 [Synechocystis sp. PCC 6714]MCT0252553.1 hypothetical protein [Synechocystis sp. CS-94]
MTNQPLLPKTNQDFAGGAAPGEWIPNGVGLFNTLGNSLEFEAGAYREVNSIPSPWSRPLQLISAFRNRQYPSRDWLIEQYRGLLTALALAENLNLKITATQVRLKDYQDKEFARCLWKLRPNDGDNVLPLVLPDGPWAELYLFELDGVAIGMTSPATIVCPTGYFPDSLSRRIAWIKNGFFTDPIKNGLAPNQREVLSPWLENLKGNLMRNPQNEDLAGRVSGVIDDYIQDLGITTSNVFQPTTKNLPFDISLAPALFQALHPAEAVQTPSNVLVIASGSRHPSKQLYIIDPVQLPGLLGKQLQEINVIDSSPLLNFDPNHHRRSDARFATPADIFQDNLYFHKTKGLLPGTWLDQKLNLDNLTILLPFKSFLREYFTSEDLEKQVELSPVSTPEGPGVRVSLTVQISGFDRHVAYTMSQEYALKAENEIKQDFPTLALWPNVPPDLWKEYFLLVETTEEYGELAFRVDQPTPNAQAENRRSGQESYQYWKCDSYPDVLLAIDKNAQPLGLIPLRMPKAQGGNATSWTVGVDFGTSFTNIYVRKGANGTPERLQLKPYLLKVTKRNSEIETPIYREFFIPELLLPEGNNPPMSTVLTTKGWAESEGEIPDLITNARIYIPRLDKYEFDKEYIKTNIKWKQVQYQRPFLGQLVRMISAKAALEGVRNIEWSVSYPSAFSPMDINRYNGAWQQVLKDLDITSNQNHSLQGQGLKTESIAFAQFFGDVLKKNLIYTTCVDIGGGTSDISVWQDNQLVHQASVPYAGRDIFHSILEPNLAFIGDIFGLPPEAGRSVAKVLGNQRNFNASLDIYLRANSERILSEGYIMNADKPRNRQFRTLLALSFGGLFHYLGMIQKELKKEEFFNDSSIITSILMGGNGSRFLHWLTSSGVYTQNSEINNLARGILMRASDLNKNPDLLTLSPQPKEEACGGLVVSSAGTKLSGFLGKKKDYPFTGENCVINGENFSSSDRLNVLERGWEEISSFEISSYNHLEEYLKNFNDILREESIQEIDQLRNFNQGGLFNMDSDFRILLEAKIKQVCLRKVGPTSEFEIDPPFLIILKSFIAILAEQWSKITG